MFLFFFFFSRTSFWCLAECKLPLTWRFYERTRLESFIIITIYYHRSCLIGEKKEKGNETLREGIGRKGRIIVKSRLTYFSRLILAHAAHFPLILIVMIEKLLRNTSKSGILHSNVDNDVLYVPRWENYRFNKKSANNNASKFAPTPLYPFLFCFWSFLGRFYTGEVRTQSDLHRRNKFGLKPREDTTT